MAQLKAGSTTGGVEIAKKNWSNVTVAFPSGLVSQLKGDAGANGSTGSNGIKRTLDYQSSTSFKEGNSNKTWTVAGSALTIA